MLLNHNDTQDSLFTLAHEGGHAMHTVLSHENQPFVTADYTIFVAEVASTTNERFLLNHLLKATNEPKERFLLLQHGKPITSDVLNNIYLKLLKDYYGDAVTIDDLYKYTWSRIPHFYNSPY